MCACPACRARLRSHGVAEKPAAIVITTARLLPSLRKGLENE